MTQDPEWVKNPSILPEYEDTYCVTDDNGLTTLHRKAPQFVAFDIKPYYPLAFRDAEGAWLVEYNYEGGPHKRRAWFWT